MKKEKIIKKGFVFLLFTFIFSIALTLNIKEVKAESYEGNSKEIESILKDIVARYGEENITFEDGIILNQGETIELPEDSLIIWTSEDSSIVKVEGNTLTAEGVGTTFIIGEGASSYHIREVYVSDNTEAIATFSNDIPESRLKSQYVVYLDPGHGGYDPGASGNGIIEKNLVLDLAFKVKDKLESAGVKVIMSRTSDVYVSLQDRASEANNLNPDIFISIHINSAGAASASGIETYYYKSIDKSLADNLQPKLISYTGAVNRGVKWESFYVVRETNMPSSLIEIGFLTNVNEANNMKSSSYQEKLANAIFDGSIKYLRENIDLGSNGILEGNRIYGNNRYETSYEILNRGWSSSEYAILASGIDYPDALCAAPLASKYKAPILLVDNTSLANQPNLLASLKSKGISKVFIIGGTTAVSSEVESGIRAAGINVTRVGGSDRYETSVKIAQLVGSTTGEVAIANGLDFADGLSISSVAAIRNMPILLTDSRSLPSVVSNYVNSLNINKTYVIGSEVAVSSNVANSLNNVERLGGANRYETNRNIFNRFKSDIGLNNLYIASGRDFPDALSISALAGKETNFVLLSNTNYSEESIRDILSSVKTSIGNLYILGGQVVIPDSVLKGLGIAYIR